MSYINKYFILDDFNLKITDKSIYDLNKKCLVMKYEFHLEIVTNIIDPNPHIEINKIITSYDERFIQMIKESEFIIINEQKLFTDFKIRGKFSFKEYTNNKAYFSLLIQEEFR